jgi:uncharacterized protein YjiS (DUF1127 family)
MTCTLTDTPTRTAPRPGPLAGLRRRLRRWHAADLAERRLRGLDDHLLRDIGIDRADIGSVVRNGR